MDCAASEATPAPCLKPQGLVSLIDLVGGLSRALDLVSPAVVNHHNRVGFLASRLAAALGLPAAGQRDLLLAGLMHDSGALSLKSRLDALQFESDGAVHAQAGFRLIRTFARLDRVAELVRHHHRRFDCLTKTSPEALPEGNILALADRVDALISRNRPLGEQAEGIRRRIASKSGSTFSPLYVQAFLDISASPDFWDQAARPAEHLHTLAPERLETEALPLAEVREFSRLFSLIIDFRTRFTATHSRGVAHTAERLAQLAGFSDHESQRMRVAGNLHDLGKLAVSREILNKPGAPDANEWAMIKSHPGHSRQVLSAIAGLEDVCLWASSHHERMDGKGYPDGLAGQDIPLGSRVVAATDVFTAITEDRPYRAGMDAKRTRKVLEQFSGTALDADLVELLLDNMEEFNELRIEAQEQAIAEFNQVSLPEAEATCTSTT